MKSLGSKSLCLTFALAIIALVPVALKAQVRHESARSEAANDLPSKWDIFVGYSYLQPNGTVQGYPYQNIVFGGVASVTRYFNKYVGLQFEGDWHDQSQNWPPGSDNSADNSNDDFANGSGGLILRYPAGNFTPFVHASLAASGLAASFSPTPGAGLRQPAADWTTTRRGCTIIWPYAWSRRIFSMPAYPLRPITVAAASFNIARLSGGVVFHFGSIKPPSPVAMACTPNPVLVYPGDPVTVIHPR